MTIRLLAYARTSTDDNQSPEDSLRWQLDRARILVDGHGEIVEVAHDTNTSRAIPWPRRPEASRILAALCDARRRWEAIVVGEPQRAFGSAAQVQLVLAQLAHYDVGLWVPEVGGPVDPDSEAHDILLSLFGGLSRAERNRLRVRVRSSMRAMAPTGRFLGGRPPYGYVLVSSGALHPNPEKARHGIELTHLQPDPETSPIVQRIFEMRAEGVGFRAIAARLTAEGIASPSGHDRQRNPHRLGRAWSLSAVRAIVLNPRYKGTATFGRYRKVERLFDPTDPAAGHVTRMTPAEPTSVVTTEGIIPALVDADQWQRAQPGRAPTSPGPRPDRSEPTRYALRGLLVCGQCGRMMQGNTVRRYSGKQVFHYRCTYRTEYPGDEGHPKGLAVAEHRILPVIDHWLSQLFDPARQDVTVAEILAADSRLSTLSPEQRRAQRQVIEADSLLDRYVKAIEEGVDPSLLAPRIRTAQAEKAAAAAVLNNSPRGAAFLTELEIRELLSELGGLPGRLANATPSTRRSLYADAGLLLRYHRHPEGELVTASLRVELLRVGGAIFPPTTREAVLDLAA